MSIEFDDTTRRHPMIRLLDVAFGRFTAELQRRVADTPYSDIRVTHGCVFGNIDPDGSRLTERGHAAQALGRQLIDEIERDWAERFGAERVALLRETLEAITAEQLGAVPVA